MYHRTAFRRQTVNDIESGLRQLDAERRDENALRGLRKEALSIFGPDEHERTLEIYALEMLLGNDFFPWRSENLNGHTDNCFLF